MSASPRSEESIFSEALNQPPAERAAFLEKACGADAPLRERMEKLLKSHTGAGSFLAEPLAVTTNEPLSERPGMTIGPYKLLQQIGEGGMGVVYMAEQEEPVRRRVALKIIKPGMDSQQVIARFEAERQALAMMDHQNIARVLDAGTTESGRPYFVMELVHGVPLTKFCDDNRLTPRERLELFVPVCHAIQHAHQKGVIHRDIKPGNILVTMYDDKPVPKVIDFGVAKAVEQRLTEKTLFTQFGTLVGTFEYMSPEQAEMNAYGVDTRSDVYSLGVLLYEMLTGTTPLERKRLREAALTELVRLIKEEEPPRPSVRLSTSAFLPKVAAACQTEPGKLSQLVRGELDWIVMKCLEKDRTRRYETANGLARDVQRYLSDEPVEACPPSPGYRLRKLLRKHRAAVLTAAALTAVLMLGVVVSTWQAVRATRAERDALRAREQESKQRQLMEDQRNRAIQAEGVARANEQKARDEERKAREMIVDMMVLLRAFQNQVADVTAAYKANGKLDQAVSFYEQTVAAVKARSGSEHNSTYVSMSNLALVYQAAGKRDEAIALFELALPVLKAGPGPKHPITLSMMSHLAEAYNDARQPDLAIPLFEQTVPAWTAILGATDDYTLTNMNNLGFAYSDGGKFDKAIPLLQQVVKVRQTKHGQNHWHTLTSMKNLADAYRFDRKFDQAIPLYEQMVEAWMQMDGPDDPDTHIARHNLAIAYRDAGRFQEALPLLEEAVSGFKRLYGLADGESQLFQRNLADLYEKLKQAERAEPLRRELVPITKESAGADSPAYAYELHLLGLNLQKRRKFSAAEPLLRECLTIREQKLPDDWLLFNTRSLLGANLLGQKKHAEAEPLLVSGYEGMKQRETKIPAWAKHRPTETLARLVQLYREWDKPDEAAKWQKELDAAEALEDAKKMKGKKA